VGDVSDDPTDRPPPRPPLLLAAVGIAVLETVALVAYALGIGISDLQDSGNLAAAPVEIVIYLLFAVGVAVCGLGLWRRRRSARTPFGVVQLFGVIIGWTLTQGDGDLTHRIGYVVLAVAVVGIAVVISPGLGDALDS
jgi:hypothetical protein